MKCLRTVAFTMVLTMLFMIAVPVNAYANGMTHLYAYTYDTNGHEEYASTRVASFMNTYGHNSADLVLGKGIRIDSQDTLERVLFPIWESDKIVAALLVSLDDDGTYYGSYSELYAKQLDALKSIATNNNPLALVAADDGFYAVVSDQWYDLDGEVGEYFVRGYPQNELNEVIDTREPLPHVEAPQTRASTTYVLPFTIYHVAPGNAGKCYAYALGNILMNMGYNYTPFDILAYTGQAQGVRTSVLANYLSSKGLSCTYKEPGYLESSKVGEILRKKQYIYLSAKNITDQEGAHALVLFGYADDGLMRTYNIWNPWSNYTQVMDADTRKIELEVNHKFKTFLWNNGYLYDIK